ncbi:uncharacterized protein LOC127061225 [Serinus canaria]|uniref:uncharacterized protein LOC127061225 n=1 Tax=Serinus canaria TaxID=9135 RepID=UPI0021CCC7B7|nr:uncharacterized protein LOC127061225 [Serinus canaria]
MKYFAFEWEDPNTGLRKQLTWTRLPQGFSNSPTIFGNQLAKELEEWRTTQVKEPPSSETAEGELAHDCMEIIEQVYSSRMDLKDTPMEDPDWELFTDGSSFVENGTRYAGYSVVSTTQVIEAKALPPGTSAQKAEVIGLTRALVLSAGKKVNIWTDSKYAFGVVHIHGALWKERGLLSAQGTMIKHHTEVLALLEAVHKPEKVAVMHVRGHQKEEGKIFQGNRLADSAAKEAARLVWTQMALIPTKVTPISPYLNNHHTTHQRKKWPNC